MNIREFLKQNKALTKFKANFQAQKATDPHIRDMSPERYLREWPDYEVLVRAFHWGRTPEDFWFWSTLNNDWRESHRNAF